MEQFRQFNSQFGADKNDSGKTTKQEYSIVDQFIYPAQIQDLRIQTDDPTYIQMATVLPQH